MLLAYPWRVLFMPSLCRLFVLLALLLPVFPTTLEQLSLDQMIAKSSFIFRGKAIGTSTSSGGAVLYTRYRFQVTETLKGTLPMTVDIDVPGGTNGRQVQTITGAPVLTQGTEYVVFVWTNSRKQNLILGLSQGLFATKMETGKLMLLRGVSQAPMVDSHGRPVDDGGMRLGLSVLRDKVKEAGEQR